MNPEMYFEENTEEKFSPWSVYSDLLCSLLMIFMLLFFYAIYQYLEAKEMNRAETEEIQQALIAGGDELSKKESVLSLLEADLINQESQIERQRERIEAQQGELSALLLDLEEKENAVVAREEEIQTAKLELEASNQALERAQSALNEKEAALAEKDAQLQALGDDLSGKQAEIDGQNALLMEKEAALAVRDAQLQALGDDLSGKQAEIDEQNALLMEKEAALAEKNALLQALGGELGGKQVEIDRQQALLEDQNEQLAKIVGIRARLVKDLRQALDRENIAVSIDSETGAIVFDSAVLFTPGSAELSEEGQAFISAFFPLYYRMLFSDAYAPYVSEIVVEGHTDTDGTFLFNLELSQRRALSVASFCVADDCAFLDDDEVRHLRGVLSANGKSFSQPILDGNGAVDKERSRRVVIKFRLKDQEMIDDLKRILESS